MAEPLQRRADLHAHTTASDGLDSPAALVRLAGERGISVLGVTDHDTVGGVSEALAAGKEHQIAVVAGVEFSIRARRGQTHILGYGIDVQDVALTRALEELRRGREARGATILVRLAELGIELPQEALPPERPGNSPGRPHVARALVEIGAAESVQDAFDKYLAVGRPAFVPRRTLAGVDAIELIRAAGGLAVLAHPLSVYQLESALPALVDAGLVGLEAYYGEYNHAQRETLAEIARAYNLLVTGGSDYHGALEARGRVLGSVEWPVAALETLLERLK